MTKLKTDICCHCGGKGGNLIFISDGKEAKVRHESPFECVEVLRKEVAEVDGRTGHLIKFGGG